MSEPASVLEHPEADPAKRDALERLQKIEGRLAEARNAREREGQLVEERTKAWRELYDLGVTMPELARISGVSVTRVSVKLKGVRSSDG